MGTPVPDACEEPAEVVRGHGGEVGSDAPHVHRGESGPRERVVTAGGDGVGVAQQHVDLRDTGCDERVGAGRGPAVMRARFERDDRDGPPCGLASSIECDDLGVATADGLGRALRDDDTVPHDQAADRWVRARDAGSTATDLEGAPVERPGQEDDLSGSGHLVAHAGLREVSSGSARSRRAQRAMVAVGAPRAEGRVSPLS